MKKMVMIAAAALLLASCASGWKCSTRYCDSKKQQSEQKQNA